MTIDHNRALTVPDDVLVRELEGESVILNLKTEQYLGLDPIGTRMLQQLTGSPSIEAAFEALLSEYEVEPEALRGDLDQLIDKLLELQVVALAD